MKTLFNFIHPYHSRIYSLIAIFCGIYFIGDLVLSFYGAFQHGWSIFLNDYVKMMQDILFFYALISIFIKKPALKYILYCLPIATLEVNFSIFSTYVHPLLIHSHFYSLFSHNVNNISPEYTRIVFFIVILCIYFITLLKKRTFHIIFLFISMASLLSTAILFHTITLKQLDYYSLKQENTWKQILNLQNEDQIKYTCDLLNIRCHIYANTSDPFILYDSPVIYPYANIVKPYWDNNKLYFYYTITNDNHISDRITSRKPIGFVKNTQYKVVIEDLDNYTSYLKFNQLLFGILAFCSHIVWLCGSVYLIYFHEKRTKNKYVVVKK